MPILIGWLIDAESWSIVRLTVSAVMSSLESVVMAMASMGAGWMLQG